MALWLHYLKDDLLCPHGVAWCVWVLLILAPPYGLFALLCSFAWGLGYEEQKLTMCGGAEPWGTFCSEPPCGQVRCVLCFERNTTGWLIAYDLCGPPTVGSEQQLHV